MGCYKSNSEMQINSKIYIILPFKELGKEEQIKPKGSRRKDIWKITVEIIETKKIE